MICWTRSAERRERSTQRSRATHASTHLKCLRSLSLGLLLSTSPEHSEMSRTSSIRRQCSTVLSLHRTMRMFHDMYVRFMLTRNMRLNNNDYSSQRSFGDLRPSSKIAYSPSCLICRGLWGRSYLASFPVMYVA